MKLYILQGLPASGKSTRAAEIVATGNWVRLNKDLVRTMLHFDKFNGKNEGYTKDASATLAKHFLQQGVNVVIDDTNFGKTAQAWKDVARACGASFELETMTTPWRECVARDALREKKVGFNVIAKMALNNGLIEQPEKGFVICDLDGTLCDISHRLHFVKNLPEGTKPDWKSFFNGIPEDSLRKDTWDKLKQYEADGHPIVFMSGRPITYEKQTQEWLVKHKVEVNVPLLMRRAGDTRPDTEVKLGLFEAFFKDKYKVHAVLDDRPCIVRLWQSLGLNVIDVGAGVEF